VALVALSAFPATSAAQPPIKLKKLKDAVKKAVDTTVSSQAARAIDSSRLAKPLAPVAALIEGNGCGSDSTSVGTTVVSTTKRELGVGDTMPGRPRAACPPSSANATAPGQPAAAPAVSGAAGAASTVGTALIAAPVIAGGAKSLLGKKPPTASDFLKTLLEKGRVEVQGMRFLPGSDHMEPVLAVMVEPVAEALAALDGKVGVHVCLEANPRGAVADTSLARRRMERVWATLLSVGAPDRAFAPLAETSLDLVPESKPAKLGESEVELVLLPKEGL